MLPNIEFFYAAVPAVILVGLSKGGLGGAFALVGVPVLALVVPPVQAAAIFLPILLVMDLVALWAWRHHNDRRTLMTLLPGAIIGIAVGWATSAYVSANVMRILLGTITVVFVARYLMETYGPNRTREVPPRPHNSALATFWSLLSGYSSFVAQGTIPAAASDSLPS
jgi:uncharacterized membrane protein YfcA